MWSETGAASSFVSVLTADLMGGTMNSFCRAMLGVALAGGMVAGVSGPAGASSCTIKGTNGDDVLAGTDGPDVICAYGGNDVIHALGGNDIVYGGPGDDEIHGGPGADRLWGKTGNDTIYGDEGNDKIGGAAGNDRLHGGPGNDTIYGSDGDDRIEGGTGSDRLLGQAGEDVMFGGAEDNPTSGKNVLGGGADYDILHAGVAGDILYFGTGAGEAYGNVGKDRIIGPTRVPAGTDAENAVYIIGGGEADFIVMGAAGPGTNRKSLLDEIYYPGSFNTWNVVDGDGRTRGLGGPSAGDVVYGGAFNDYIEGAELVWGRAGDDIIGASGFPARFFGEAGNDQLSGGPGDDVLVGGPGDDYLAGRKGADLLRGGPGADNISGDSDGSDGGNTIWAGTDKDVDTVYAVESDRCGASREDIIHGACTR